MRLSSLAWRCRDCAECLRWIQRKPGLLSTRCGSRMWMNTFRWSWHGSTGISRTYVTNGCVTWTECFIRLRQSHRLWRRILRLRSALSWQVSSTRSCARPCVSSRPRPGSQVRRRSRRHGRATWACKMRQGVWTRRTKRKTRPSFPMRGHLHHGARLRTWRLF